MARRGAAGRPDAVEAAADELYGLPLDEFTAARNERAKQARAQGDGAVVARNRFRRHRFRRGDASIASILRGPHKRAATSG